MIYGHHIAKHLPNWSQERRGEDIILVFEEIKPASKFPENYKIHRSKTLF